VQIGETVRAVISGKARRFTVAEELGFASNRWSAGREQTRFDEVEAVKTDKGKYVLQRSYITMWQGEHCSYNYQLFDSIEDLVAALDPLDSLDRRLLDKLGKLDEVSEEI